MKYITSHSRLATDRISDQTSTLSTSLIRQATMHALTQINVLSKLEKPYKNQQEKTQKVLELRQAWN